MSQNESIVGLGARTDHVAVAPNVDPARFAFSADERKVFECIGRAAQIQEVLGKAGFAEPKTIALLLALRAKGAIVPARIVKPAVSDVPVSAAASEEVDLDPVRKKEILDFERVIDGQSHFTVLGLSSGAEVAEVKKAFYEASRRFHPDRFFGKNLGSFRARIERIFRRLSEAHQVLADPARREAYLKQHPELTPAPSATAAGTGSSPADAAAAAPQPEDPSRAAERRARMAKHPYLAKSARLTELVSRARAHMAKGDFGAAYTDLHMAAQINEKNAEVADLLSVARRQHEVARAADEVKLGAECETMGDHARAVAHFKTASNIDPRNGPAAYKVARAMWRAGEDAKESKIFAQRAVDADPKNADYRVLLGQLLLDAGMKAMAKRQFEEALKLKPGHPEAKKHVNKFWPF